MKRWLFLIWGLLILDQASAQQLVNYPSYWDNYLIENYTMEEHGLPGEAVYGALQSSDGFVWIVCNLGLVRYDGISMKVYGTENTSYTGSTLYEIHEDSKGNFWLPTIGEGIVKFKDEEFHHYGAEHGLSSDIVKSMAVSSGDTVWVGTYGNGLQAFYGDTVIATYTTDDGLIHNQVWRLIIDQKNRVWVGTNGGVSVLENGRFTNFTTENGLPFNVIRGLTEMDNGDIWAGTDREGIIVFDDLGIKRYYHTKDGLNDLDPQYFAQYPEDGSIWIAHHGNGVDRFENGNFTLLNTEDGLVSNFTTFVYFTKEGLGIIGSETGFSILRKRKIDVLNTEQGLSENLLINVNQDSNGVIWAGTDGKGFNYYKDGTWNVIEYPPDYTNGYASGAAAHPDGSIWFNSKGTGTVRIEDYKVTHYYGTADGIASGFARGIAFDQNGQAWIGTNDGINLIHNDGAIKTYTVENGLSHNFTMTGLGASDGAVWMGSFGGGVSKFKNGTLIVYDTSNVLLSNKVYTLFEDSEQGIWISGSYGGLVRISSEDTLQFSIDDGLPTEGFNAILDDDFGNLWLGSGSGIFKIRKKDLYDYAYGELETIPYVRYNMEDGFPSNTLEVGYTSTATKIRSGELLFGTNNGIAVIHPQKMQESAPVIRPYIDEVLVNGVKVNLFKPIVIKPENNRLQITYSAFNFTAPSKTNFRVKLDGTDINWVNMGKRQTVYYDFLPDADYTFRVEATNADGQWNSETAVLNFLVLPPFYKTWWFIGLALLVFGCIIAAIVRVRYNFKMNELNRELAVQQKIKKERERISRDLHDNVGSQITNLITGLEISNLHIKKEETNEALSVINNLDADARQAMTELRETIWLLNQHKVTMTEFKKHVTNFVKRQKYSLNGLDFSFTNNLKEEDTLQPTQSLHLMRIFQEALNNCRKYAEATEFSIKLQQKNNHITALIRDNGKGMNTDDCIGKGNGLENMRRRAAEMKGACSIESTPGKGTSITVTFPIIP